MSGSIIVFEDHGWQRLLPLVYFRAVFQLRCGMGTLLERIKRLADDDGFTVDGMWCRPMLSSVLSEQAVPGVARPALDGDLLINGRGLWNAFPDDPGVQGSWVGVAGPHRSVACIRVEQGRGPGLTSETMLNEASLHAELAGLPRIDVSDCVTMMDWPWNLVHANEPALEDDWSKLTVASSVDPYSQRAGVHLLAPESIRIGVGTRIKPCVVIDAEDGPVWIGRNVRILPHSYIQGPAYIGDDCLLQPGAAVHAGTSIGPMCKVGGEIEASIIQGFSNKQHDGFLGHSYVASWINIAADCINSDLKNTYGNVRVPINGKEVDTGNMFVGMFVGDFSKAGINVSFPTGSVIGFCSSVFASQSPKFVPSYAWLNRDDVERFDVKRGIAIARKVMARRQQVLTPAQANLFASIRQQALALEMQSQWQIEDFE